MKTRFKYLVSLFLGFVLSSAAFAGDVDVHFGPEGQESTQTISGNIESAEDRLNLIPDDAKKSNEVFDALTEKAQASLAAPIEAVLVSNLDGTQVAVQFVLVNYQGKVFFVAELDEGQQLVWEYVIP